MGPVLKQNYTDRARGQRQPLARHAGNFAVATFRVAKKPYSTRLLFSSAVPE
jgi:hypothetical protein